MSTACFSADRFFSLTRARSRAHRGTKVKNSKFVRVVAVVPVFCTVILRNLGLPGGGTMFAKAVTVSFGPAVSVVKMFHSRLARPVVAPTQAASSVAFIKSF